MEEYLDDTLEETQVTLTLSDRDIFTRIWTSPREVFRYINDNKYDKFVKVLLVFAGISRAFDQASMKDMGDSMSLIAILGFCIVIGGLLGWISLYFYAALISWTGGWLKGKGNTDSILRILAYAMFPSAIALIMLIPQIGAYGAEVFKAEGDLESGGLLSNLIFWPALILEMILGVWTLVLYVVGVSEVQKLSIGKSILNLLLPILVILVPILLVVLVAKAL